MRASFVAFAVAAITLVGLLLWRDAQMRARLDQISAQLASPRTVAPLACPPPMLARVIDSATSEAPAGRAAVQLRRHQSADADVATPEKIEAQREPTPEQLAAVATAQRQLDAALARGRLGRDDVTGIRQQLASAGAGDAAQELSQKIAMAINAGRLVPEDPQLVFP